MKLMDSSKFHYKLLQSYSIYHGILLLQVKAKQPLANGGLVNWERDNVNKFHKIFCQKMKGQRKLNRSLIQISLIKLLD